jgi:tellurite resistance protein TerB
MKMTGFINNSPELKVFNLTDVIKVFNACASSSSTSRLAKPKP